MSLTLEENYAECRYTECHYAECRCAEGHYTECRYTECRYGKCLGTRITPSIKKCLESQNWIISVKHLRYLLQTTNFGNEQNETIRYETEIENFALKIRFC
jgi:hypothetical protein